MKTRQVLIVNKLGLHARAAAKVVHVANEFESDVYLCTDSEEVNAKSILGLLTLAATCGTTVTLKADGPDEHQALDDLEHLFEDRFGEGQ